MLPSLPLVQKKDVKLTASEVWTLENKWLILIFNKSQITEEIQGDKNSANVISVFTKA